MSCAVDTAWHKRGFDSLTFQGGHFPHITLIAAAELNSRHSFNTYVLPKTLITATAQQVTGIVMSGSNSVSKWNASGSKIYNSITGKCFVKG